jgi:hypothetical protein
MDKRNNIDSLDANDVIGGTLLSKDQNVNVYTSPTGKLIGTIKANTPIGVVYSWTVDAADRVWFQLESTPDKPMWVASASGRFDQTYLENSLAEAAKKKAAIVEAVAQERMDNNQSSLYQFGKDPVGAIGDVLGDLKWYLIGIVVLILILKFK